MSDYGLLPIGNEKKKKQLSFDEALQLLGGEKPQESSLLSRVGDAGLDLAKGVIGAGEAAIGVGDIVTGGNAGKLLKDYAGYDPKSTRGFLSENYSDARQKANQEVENSNGFIDTTVSMLKNPSTISGAVLESAPSIVGGGGSARLLGKAGVLLNNPVARGAIGEGIVGAGQNAEQIRQETSDGLLAPKQALASAASGITTGLIGYGGGKVAQKMGILDPQTVLAGGYPLPKGMSRQTLGNVAKGFVSEGALQELPQSATEQMWQNYAQDNPLMEGVPEASAAGLLAGGVMGAGTNLVHSRGHKKTNNQEINNATPPESSSRLLLGYDSPNNPNSPLSPKFNPNLDTNFNPVVEDLKARADNYGLPNVNPVAETLNRGVSESFPIPAKPTGIISKALQAGNLEQKTRVLEGELLDRLPDTIEQRNGINNWIDGEYSVIDPLTLEQQRRLAFNQESQNTQDIPRLYTPNSRSRAVDHNELRNIVRAYGAITPKQLMSYTGSNSIQAERAVRAIKQEQKALSTNFESASQAKTALKKLADHASFEIGRLANSNHWLIVPKQQFSVETHPGRINDQLRQHDKRINQTQRAADQKTTARDRQQQKIIPTKQNTKPSPQRKAVTDPISNLTEEFNALSEADLIALLDEIGHETKAVETDKPVKVRKQRVNKKQTTTKRTVSNAERTDTNNPQALERTASRIAKDMGVNLSSAGKNWVKGLTTLFGGKGKLSSGLTFDEQTYAKAKPHFVAMLNDFQSAGKNLRDFLKAILDNFGTGVKPYVMRFAQDLKEGNINVSDASLSMERNSQDSGATNTTVPETISDETSRTRSSTGEPSQRTGESVPTERESDNQLSNFNATSDGSSVHSGIHRENTASRVEKPLTRNTEQGRISSDSHTGSDVEQARTADIIEHSRTREPETLHDKQLAANKQVATHFAEKDNIQKALPTLFEGQIDDVYKAEQRFFKDNQLGILFTNGTGTGKTGTGSGVISRFVSSGKDNIITVVPNDKIARDWVSFLNNRLDVPAKQLDSITDHGKKGVVVTTYANFGSNDALSKRNWDLIVTDESHYLSSDEQGTVTSYLNKLRLLTGHYAGRNHFAKSYFSEDYKIYSDNLLSIERAIEKLNPEKDQAKIERLVNKRYALHEQWQQKEKEAQTIYKEKPKSKVLMLSATPFAYVKNIDYAEGYLFNYDSVSESEAYTYNAGDGRERFFMEHFGYRMRYNKLTRPDGKVNGELMEQQFNEWLKKQGALSGRRLDIPYDYDRKFFITEDAVGTKLDNAFEEIREAIHNDETLKDVPPLYKLFPYHERMYLLEAIKAKHAVDYIKENIKLGRKVVVFHDFNKGGASNPYQVILNNIKDNSQRNKIAAILAQPHLRADFSDLVSPINRFARDFDNTLFINGTFSKSVRERNITLFNQDGSGYNLLVVQSDAGREGISMHDTTGKHQRVLINLGLPTRPVASTQIEGRIYRTGQASNAIFRYFTTGTGWESSAFTHKIAERASTAENLALGLEARGLKQAFLDAYANALDIEIAETDGTGGKVFDREAAKVITGYDAAKAYYYGQQKNTKRRDQREGTDYYATPEPVGYKMAEWADINQGDKVLEPSAGHGAIARFIPDGIDATAIEPSYKLSNRIGLSRAGTNIINDRFENHNIINKYDAIVMNPPYGTGGKTAMEHLEKAIKHLKHNGRVIALVPRGQFDKRFDSFLESKDAEGVNIKARILLPSVTFENAGTSVSTQILVIDKNTLDQGHASIDLTGEKTINELFDRLENIELRPRAKERVPASTMSGESFDASTNNSDLVEHTTKNGKVIKGIISGLPYKEAKAIDKYTFKKEGGYFIREQYLDENNNPSVDSQYHRTTATKEAYEKRIDALFNRDKANTNGVMVLDSSDILNLLGFNNTPMYLAENKVIQGQVKHKLTADHWKKIPEWLENPVAVYNSDTVGGRLVVVAPETLNNQSIVMILEPETDTGGKFNIHLLLNAYDRDVPIPAKKWFDDGKLRYIDLQKSPAYSRQTGLKLPVSYRTLRGYESTIYTDRDLVNYRQANNIAFNQAVNRNTPSSNAAELSEKVNSHIKGWENAPKIKVVQSIDDLPRTIKDKVIHDNALDVNGIHHNGEVYLIADNISSPKEALLVAEHEVMGHYGLRGVFGNKINPLLNNIYKNNKEVRRQADGLARKYGYDKTLATEEVLADMAASNDIKNMSFWNSLVAAFRNFSRKVGLTTKWTDNDIAYLLSNSRRYVETGKSKNISSGQQYSRAGQLLESGIEWLNKKTDKSEKVSDRVTAEQRKIMQEKFAMFQPKNLKERAEELTNRLNEKLIQGIFDSFAPLKNINEEAYMQAHLSKGTEGAVEALLKFGKPKMQDGALNVETDGKGLFGILSELNSKDATELNEWLSWMAANRAEILKRQGRENLFTDEDIKELKKLSEGEMSDGRNRAKVYENVRKQVMEYNKAVLDIAEESGLIDKENRKTWENGFYLPFYRVAEEEGGFSIGSANKLVGQQAFKKLKGGTNALDDLLVNMVSNWSHLLTASMKNQAGLKTLKSSTNMGIADKLNRLSAGEYLNNRTDEFRKGGQNVVWVMEDGQQQFYQINDPLVFDALNMINHKGWNNPLIKLMSKFKTALTIGVTSSPTFRVRNLLRDTVQASAITNISYNPIANLVKGFNSTAHRHETMNTLIASGGAIRFGAMNDGNQGYQYRRLIKELNIGEDQVLNTPEKAKKALANIWHKYQELGDRGETINRAAIYEKAIADGKTHLQASFEARDLMNFTSAGKWAAVRFLNQVLPFFNARLQGLYKLGRSAKEDPKRFGAVVGAVALASSLLYLLQKDDDDYKELPDWVRDTYWYVKFGDKALYIPKPFEVGALGSIAERGLEFALAGDDYTAKDFASTLTSILSDQLAMNPVPQIVRPAMEASFNYDSFRGSSIDSMGQERLNPSDRYTASTSAGAIATGKVLNVSPQRIEHMVRGYFGWLGTQALNVTDIATRPLTDLPSNPNKDFTRINNVLMLGDFVKDSNIGSGSKYLSRFYDSQKQIDQVYASLNNARKIGELEHAQELAKDDKLKLRRLYTTANKSITNINQRMKAIRADKELSSSEKNTLITELQRQRNELAKRVDNKAREYNL